MREIVAKGETRDAIGGANHTPDQIAAVVNRRPHALTRQLPVTHEMNNSHTNDSAQIKQKQSQMDQRHNRPG
jgi:hypothetical protein